MKLSKEDFCLCAFRYEPAYIDGIDSWESVASGLIHAFYHEQNPDIDFDFGDNYRDLEHSVVALLKQNYCNQEEMLQDFRDFQQGL